MNVIFENAPRTERMRIINYFQTVLFLKDAEAQVFFFLMQNVSNPVMNWEQSTCNEWN